MRQVLFLFFFSSLAFQVAYSAPSCRALFAVDRTEAKALQLIQDQSELFEKMWQRSQIQVPVEEALSRVQNIKSVSTQNALQALQNDQLAVTMVVPSSVRNEIASKGFLNIYETGISRGASTIVGRTAVEASFTGMSYSAYDRKGSSIKPKYAFLNPRLHESKAARFPEHYGDDIFTFKTAEIEDRLTFTIGDSLNYLAMKEDYEANEKALKEDIEKDLPSQEWMTGFVHRAKGLYDVYVPFKFKKLIALFLDYPSEVEKGVHIKGAGNELGASYHTRKTALSEIGLPPHYYESSYIEVQIWGGVDLSHVESFTFRNRPPEGAFLKALKKHGIKIYDGRNRPEHQGAINHYDQKKIKLWNEAEESGIYFDGHWVDPQNKNAEMALLTEELPNEKVQSSNGGKWVQSADGQIWFEKADGSHQELQSSAEAISSRIYRLLGYAVPETHKVMRGGKYFSISKYIGKPTVESNLSESSEYFDRTLRVVAAYLKDWDRVSNPNNNRKTADGKIYLIDFGGTLGSRSRGDFKDGPIVSEAIGALDVGENKDIFRSFNPQLGKKHPWMKLSKHDLLSMADRLIVNLTDGNLFDIVREAKFSRKEDERMMFEILKQRRNNLVAELQELGQ
jgi:hypothetical protein